MGKQKYYAVKQGRIPGIFLTWEDCKKSTEGYPGAVFKSFPTKEEAENYLKGQEGKREESNDRIKAQLHDLKCGEMTAFVDGSFDAEKERAGYGVILIDEDGKETELSGTITKEGSPELLAFRNVAAELEGAKAAVDYAIAHGKEKLNLYYDYAGIGNWADGSWEAKKDLTKAYVAFLEDRRKKIGIAFIKVDAHTGIEYNERVDRIAKASLEVSDG